MSAAPDELIVFAHASEACISVPSGPVWNFAVSALPGLARTLFNDPGAEHFYDQIGWFTKGQKHRPVLTLEATTGGHINFVPELQGERTLTELSWHLSDHYPLSMEFTTRGP